MSTALSTTTITYYRCAAATVTVSLREGDILRGSATLTGGTAMFILPVDLVGDTHTRTAAYSGSDHLDPAQATVTVTVSLSAA